MTTLFGWLAAAIVAWGGAEMASAQMPFLEPQIDPIVVPVIDPDGPSGARTYRVLSFDGGDNVATTIAAADALDGIGALTIEAWVWRQSSAASGQVCGRGTSSNDYIGFGSSAPARGDTDDLEFNVRTVGITGGYTRDNCYVQQQWMHIAGVFDGSLAASERIKIYVNGVAKTVTMYGTLPTATASVDAPIVYGNNYTLASGMTGYIGFVRVWSVARTQAQIVAAMYTPFLGPTAGLVAEWPGIPGTGTASTDNSGNARTATFGASTASPAWGATPYTAYTSSGPR